MGRFEQVFSDIRRKTIRYDQFFPDLFMLPPPYGEAKTVLLRCFFPKELLPDIRLRERENLTTFQ